MDKEEIIEKLEKFPYDTREYWINAGSAMVMHGLRENTEDIDLGCTSALADLLEASGYLCVTGEGGRRRFRYGESIELSENWMYDGTERIDGFRVLTLRGLLIQKQLLGREKDAKDLVLIRRRIEEDGNGGQEQR
ncbi:MAG: hypothetical protein IIY63_02770 [Oscillospiraceae bacterium]|nr:hypothetical protein [Oscillospiraceae bacterium]